MDREPRRRRRVALACVDCRRRKIKCNRKQPCSHCTATRSQCFYSPYADTPIAQQHLQPDQQRQQQPGSPWNAVSAPSSHAPPASVPALAPTRVVPSGTRRSAAATAEAGGHSPSSRAPATEALATSDGTGVASRPTAAGPSICASNDSQRDLAEWIPNLDQSPASSHVHGVTETNRDILGRYTGLRDSQVTLNKSRTLGWSRWMIVAPEFAKIAACFEAVSGENTDASFQGPGTRPLLDQVGRLYQKCKVLARNIKLGRPGRTLPFNESFSLDLPSREVADTMVNLYLASFESTYRILHTPSFRAEYERYWVQPYSATTAQRLKILLVIGIGSSVCDHGDGEREFRDMVQRWVYIAQTWLSGPLEKDRLNIVSLQIYCLTILARQIFNLGGDLVWVSMGSLVHSAMQIGLHRDPKHLPAMPPLQIELRRRLWATILELAVQASLDSAMSPRIMFEEFDTEAPSNVNDDEINESTTQLRPHPRHVYTTVSLQLMLLDSMRTRLRAVHLMSSFQSELSYADTLALSSDITDICRVHTAFVKEHRDHGVTVFHQNLLNYLVRRLLIPLHFSFSSQARTNPLFYYSAKISVDTSMAIISPEPDQGFSHLMAIGGGLFKEGIRYAVVTISHHLITQVEAENLDGTLHRNSPQREILKQAVRDLIALSVNRIRHGETNIKLYAFLNMILAQVEATEVGSPCEFKITESARDSLEFCYGLLENYASSGRLLNLDNIDVLVGLEGIQEDFSLDMDLGFFLPDGGVL